MTTLSDMMTVRKWIYGNGGDERPYNLNPFCSMLFYESEHYPETFVPPTTSKHPNNSSKQSVKSDLHTWFTSLDHQQKCACTMLRNSKFLYPYLENLKNWDPTKIYHIYLNRKIVNCSPKLKETNSMDTVMASLCIAWMEEPVIYFDVEPEQSETFFNTFLKWLDVVSDRKMFELASKIKNKADPEENHLWFTQKTFQPLYAWMANQFEKAIVRNYFNRNTYDLEDFSKIKKLRLGASKNFTKADAASMLAMRIHDTKLYSLKDFENFQQKVKVYEDKYYEEVALLMDYETEDKEAPEQKAKKKKKKKNKNKKKPQVSTPEKPEQIEKEKEEETQLIPPEVDNELLEEIKRDSQEEKVPLLKEFKDEEAQMVTSLGTCGPAYEEKVEQMVEQVVDRNEGRVESTVGYQQEEEFSAQSVSWSNVETYSKSGQSHPQFSQVSSKEPCVRNQRSLSPEANPTNNSNKKKRKNKNPQTRITTRKSEKYKYNGENKTTMTRNRQEFLEEYEEEEEDKNNYHHHIHEVSKNKSEEKIEDEPRDGDLPVDKSLNGEEQGISNRQRKKKKRNNKGTSLLKELSSKISSGFLNKQLNNFVDNLSLQSNRLWDHKIVTFERISTYVRLFFPHSTATLFGSNAVGLSLPTSDIDIMLSNLPCVTKEEAIQILAQLAVQINSMAWIVSCSAYLNAKVPLIKLQIDPRIGFLETKRKNDYFLSPFDPEFLASLELKSKRQSYKSQHSSPTYHEQHHGRPQHSQGYQQKHQKYVEKPHQQPPNSHQIIKTDLTINLQDQNNFGSQSTEMMRRWTARYPQINLVTLAFKYILAQRGFSSNFKGGIGSYCLFIMIAAYMREFPHLQKLGEGQIFLDALKFYGQRFENQIKSIRLVQLDQSELDDYNRKKSTSESEPDNKKEETSSHVSSFISLEETQQILSNSSEQNQLLYNIQANPLRIIDPINNRVMSGSCYLYPQIKSQFRRIYKELSQASHAVEKEVQMTVHGSEIPKMLENKKTLEKWISKYEARSGFSMKNVLDGGC